MSKTNKDLGVHLVLARRQNPAWLLLAARRAPLVIACLKVLFEQNSPNIMLEYAEQQLAEILSEHANNDEFDIRGDNHLALARRELREWIKRRLIIERNNKIIATDALQQVLLFVDDFNDRPMTSTASRLSTVQREIEILTSQLNPDSQVRIKYLETRIDVLNKEIEMARTGNLPQLDQSKAVEGIREIHNLSMSLLFDFRRVEDSYREADRQLRKSIISEHHHRGEVVDRLLEGHAELLNTQEGQVFHGFYEQLNRSVELDKMKKQLREILGSSAAKIALGPHQHSELRWLVARLVKESATVIRARARSEHDVKGFLKTGLAAEHHRVGQLLNEIMDTANDINWSRISTCRLESTLPPIGVAVGALPMLERLLFKEIHDDGNDELDLDERTSNLDEIDENFWATFDTLDQAALLQKTVDLLATSESSLSIAQLFLELTPTHDLEALAFWLSMARQAEIPIGETHETFTVVGSDEKTIRFKVPYLEFPRQFVVTEDWEF